MCDDGKIGMGAKNCFGEKLSKKSIIRTFRNTVISSNFFLSVSLTEIFDVIIHVSRLSDSNPTSLLLSVVFSF